MKTILFLTLVLSFSALAGCQTAATETKTEAGQIQAEIAQISVTEAKKALDEKKDAQFIDVRTIEEYAGSRAVGARNLPLDKLDAELAGLDKNKPVYVICETGRRSQKGAEILQKAGFTDVYNIKGGTSEWISAGLPTEK